LGGLELHVLLVLIGDLGKELLRNPTFLILWRAPDSFCFNHR